MAFEECITIAAGAMTENWSLGERSRLPGELAATDQLFLELWRREWGISKRRERTGSAVAMLARRL